VAEGTVDGLVQRTGARNLARAFLALVEEGGQSPVGREFRDVKETPDPGGVG